MKSFVLSGRALLDIMQHYFRTIPTVCSDVKVEKVEAGDGCARCFMVFGQIMPENTCSPQHPHSGPRTYRDGFSELHQQHKISVTVTDKASYSLIFTALSPLDVFFFVVVAGIS